MVDINKDEEDKLLNHEYDGIRELDNDLPPWWINLFYITIVFGIVYFLGYQMFGWFDNQNAEYQLEVAMNDELLKKNEASTLITSNNAEDLKSEIEAGQTIFKANCVVCHGPAGGGGIGPNLTDKNWIHGGDFESICKTIAEGVPAKGMLAWKSSIGSKGVKQSAHYILSLQGTNPENAKAPEGLLYEPIDTSKPIEVLIDKESLARGAEIYSQYCSACHGVDKKGGFASNLTDKIWSQGSGSLEDVMKITSEGKIEINMPGWKSVLSEKQIQEVSSFVLEQSGSGN